MIELPDSFDMKIPANGYDLVCRYYNSIPGKSDRYLLAKKIVETFSKDELIEYIGQILYGVDVLKYKNMPTRR